MGLQDRGIYQNDNRVILRCTRPRLRNMCREGGYEPVQLPCGECYNCCQGYKLNLRGEVGAEALSCTHVDFVTLTYDSKRSQEARVGAMIKNIDHVQRWQKLIREKDRRERAKYNKLAIELSEETGEEPELCDMTRPGIKFFTQHEYGGKKGRSHWHVIVLYRSHFEMPQEVLLTADVYDTMRHARRVWNFDEIYGPPTKRRPAGARDPNVIDFRVKPDANQEHYTWTHGQVNFQRLSHDTASLKSDGTPTVALAGELANALQYNLKYIKKNKNVPAYLDLDEFDEWPQKEKDKYNAVKTTGAHRSKSQGLGRDFFDAKALQHVAAGVPIHNLNYKLAHHEMHRKEASLYKRETLLRNRGVSEYRINQMRDDRIVFQMRGATARRFCEVYRDAYKKKYGDVPNYHYCTEDYAKMVMAEEGRKANEFLNSNDAKLIREFSVPSARLPEYVPVVPYYERDQHGNPLDGTPCKVTGLKRKAKPIPPPTRLEMKRKAIDAVISLYKASPMPMHKLQGMKHIVAKELRTTEYLLKNRDHEEVDRFNKEHDIERVQKVMHQLTEQASSGDYEAETDIQYLEEWLKVTKLQEMQLERHSIHHPRVTTDIAWRWVNQSHDFTFPDFREKLIKHYCGVRYFDKNTRAVETLNGVLSIQRACFSKQTTTTVCPNTGDFLRHTGRRIWATRVAKNDDEVSRVLDGTLINRNPNDNDAIFSGPAPLDLSKGFNHLQKNPDI